MKKTTILISAALFIAPMAFAAKVDQRQIDQQKRIAQGVASGQLTARETANLEQKEARLQNEKADMREDNGGHLTAGEKVKLNHQQNVLSSQIYRDKHNRRHR